MPQRSVRIQPFKSRDGDPQPLLAFARQAAALLDPAWAPADTWQPEQRTSLDRATEGVARQEEVVRTLGDPRPGDPRRSDPRRGGGGQGYRLSHTRAYDEGVADPMVDRVLVTAYGLPEGVSLQLDCARDHYYPRYLQLDAAHPDEGVVDQVVAAFEAHYAREGRLGTADVPTALQSARAALAAREWEAAALFCEAILLVHSREAEALLYLGIARGGQGDLEASEEALRLALEAEPAHVDTWYNLGVLLALRGRHEEAIAAYHEALAIRPDNHPVLYQLGRSLEAAGQPERAREAYRAAVATSPNPHGYPGYRGMDFAREAQERMKAEGGRKKDEG